MDPSPQPTLLGLAGNYSGTLPYLFEIFLLCFPQDSPAVSGPHRGPAIKGEHHWSQPLQPQHRGDQEAEGGPGPEGQEEDQGQGQGAGVHHWDDHTYRSPAVHHS